mmetsp:Transcript_588/g.1508  ORF Transcript_588/g.1508 Transcript_588/m.1508 type:complete len:200 (-) Transcript_588:541-1140(-)
MTTRPARPLPCQAASAPSECLCAARGRCRSSGGRGPARALRARPPAPQPAIGLLALPPQPLSSWSLPLAALLPNVEGSRGGPSLSPPARRRGHACLPTVSQPPSWPTPRAPTSPPRARSGPRPPRARTRRRGPRSRGCCGAPPRSLSRRTSWPHSPVPPGCGWPRRPRAFAPAPPAEPAWTSAARSGGPWQRWSLEAPS